MNVESIAKVMEELEEYSGVLTEEEKNFITYFAYQTGDMDKTKILLKRLEELDERSARKSEIELFEGQLDKQPKEVRQIEELLISIERYRIEQQKALGMVSELLKPYGISIKIEDVKSKDVSGVEKILEERRIR